MIKNEEYEGRPSPLQRMQGLRLCKLLGGQIADYTAEQWLDEALKADDTASAMNPHDPAFPRFTAMRENLFLAAQYAETFPGVTFY